MEVLVLSKGTSTLSPCNKSIINTCVMPVLLSGCENWVLSGDCLDLLESFIGEVAKRSLKWPKHFSNNAALVAMDLQSAKSRLFLIYYQDNSI